MTSVASIRRMAYSLAKPQRAADRASPDIHVPLPLEGPGKGCCHRGRSPLRTTDRKLPGPGPRPGNVGVEGRGFRSAYRSEDTTVAPPPPAHARTKTGLRSVSRAKQRVPVAKNRQSCPAVVKIDDSSQPQGQNTRLFALPESPYANNRQNRPFLTYETAKNRPF